MPFSSEFFDMGLYRMGTDCEKWDVVRQAHGADLLPLWVADMDFQSPPAVQAAILARAAHPTYGYTDVAQDSQIALRDFWQRRHNLHFSTEDILLLPCVITGLKLAVQTLTRENDGVVIQPPVYGPFFDAVEKSGRRLMENPLIQRADGSWGMDFVQLESLFQSGAKMMMLCSPHNPVSRAWTKDELCNLAALCGQYGVALVSDEIHADFVFKPGRFVSVLETGYDNTLMLCAASKTFNLAGLQQAAMVTRNSMYLKAMAETADKNGVRAGNIFALCGTRAAYEQGDEWLDGLLAYLDQGRQILKDELAAQLPKCVLGPLDATYLAFLDVRAYGYESRELTARTLKAGVMFTNGVFFSKVHGEGFLRFNFACPHRFIREGVKRLKTALEG